MYVKFIVNGGAYEGKVELIPTGAAEASFSFEVRFNASVEITSLVQKFLDTLGNKHLLLTSVNRQEKEMVSLTSVYGGSETYIQTFYEVLQLPFPSKLEDLKDPTVSEMMDFMHPRTSAGAASAAEASFDLKEVETLYDNQAKAHEKLKWLHGDLLGKEAALLEALKTNPFLSEEAIAEYESNKEAIKELIEAQKKVCEDAFIAVADYLPSIVVPANPSEVSPIDKEVSAASIVPLGSVIPAARPEVRASGQTFFN